MPWEIDPQIKGYLFFILPPLLGAVIGYITNWLAIRMLFRPYRKWTVMGLPVPFTPGLLPSRREEIANRVGLIISEQLINEEELTRTLQDPKLSKQLAELLDKNWQFLGQEEWNLKELIQKYLSKDQQIIFLNSNEISALVLSIIQHAKFEDRIFSLLSIQFEKITQSKPEAQQLENLGNQVILYLKQGFLQSANEESQRSFIENYERLLQHWQISGTTISGVVGQDTVRILMAKIQESPEIVALFLQELLSREDFQEQLVPFIQNMLKKHWSLALLSSFLSPERLHKMIHSLAEDGKTWLNKEQNQIIVTQKLAQWLQDGAEKPLSEIGFSLNGYFHPERIVGWWLSIPTVLESIGATEKTEKLVQRAAQQFSEKTWGDWLLSLNLPSTATEIEIKLRNLFSNWLNQSENKDKIKSGIAHIWEMLLSRPLSSVLSIWQPQEEVWLKIAAEVLHILAKTIPSGLNLLDVTNMVERKLNEFPLPELEKMTLAVAGRELRAITWVGGLLGFVIGSLQLILR